MSAFWLRFWRIGIAYRGIGGIRGWRRLFWRVWWLER